MHCCTLVTTTPARCEWDVEAEQWQLEWSVEGGWGSCSLQGGLKSALLRGALLRSSALFCALLRSSARCSSALFCEVLRAARPRRLAVHRPARPVLAVHRPARPVRRLAVHRAARPVWRLAVHRAARPVWRGALRHRGLHARRQADGATAMQAPPPRRWSEASLRRVGCGQVGCRRFTARGGGRRSTLCEVRCSSRACMRMCICMQNVHVDHAGACARTCWDVCENVRDHARARGWP